MVRKSSNIRACKTLLCVEPIWELVEVGLQMCLSDPWGQAPIMRLV